MPSRKLTLCLTFWKWKKFWNSYFEISYTSCWDLAYPYTLQGNTSWLLQYLRILCLSFTGVKKKWWFWPSWWECSIFLQSIAAGRACSHKKKNRNLTVSIPIVCFIKFSVRDWLEAYPEGLGFFLRCWFNTLQICWLLAARMSRWLWSQCPGLTWLASSLRSRQDFSGRGQEILEPLPLYLIWVL